MLTHQLLTTRRLWESFFVFSRVRTLTRRCVISHEKFIAVSRFIRSSKAVRNPIKNFLSNSRSIPSSHHTVVVAGNFFIISLHLSIRKLSFIIYINSKYIYPSSSFESRQFEVARNPQESKDNKKYNVTERRENIHLSKHGLLYEPNIK